MGFSLMRGVADEDRLKQKRVRSRMTACVVAYFRPVRGGRRRGDTLRIRRRSAAADRVRPWPGRLFRSRRAAGARGAGVCPQYVRDDAGTGLDEEGPQPMLEGGDGIGVGEGGLKMGEGVCRRPVFRRQLGRRAATRQGRADRALAPLEPLPHPPPGPFTERAVRGTEGRANTAGDGRLEERPERGSGQTEPSDFVGEPDAEGVPAAGPGVAVAAKDPPGADRWPVVALVIAIGRTMPIQRADDPAVRTGRQFELLGNRVPLLVVAVKPLAHGDRASAKIAILPAWGRCGVVAGYEKSSGAGCGV